MSAAERSRREQATREATEMVAKWEHGDEEHREWLRSVAIPDIVEVLMWWNSESKP